MARWRSGRTIVRTMKRERKNDKAMISAIAAAITPRCLWTVRVKARSLFVASST